MFCIESSDGLGGRFLREIRTGGYQGTGIFTSFKLGKLTFSKISEQCLGGDHLLCVPREVPMRINDQAYHA